MSSSGHHIAVGDFNFLMDKMDSPEAMKFKELISCMNLTQYVSGETHKHGRTLDLVLTRDAKEVVTKVSVMERVWSDHNPLIFMVNTGKPAAVRKTITCRKIKGIDIQHEE